MVRVAEEDLHGKGLQLFHGHALNRRLCTHRHKDGRIYGAVSEVKPPTTRARISREDFKLHSKEEADSTEGCLAIFAVHPAEHVGYLSNARIDGNRVNDVRKQILVGARR